MVVGVPLRGVVFIVKGIMCFRGWLGAGSSGSCRVCHFAMVSVVLEVGGVMLV